MLVFPEVKYRKNNRQLQISSLTDFISLHVSAHIESYHQVLSKKTSSILQDLYSCWDLKLHIIENSWWAWIINQSINIYIYIYICVCVCVCVCECVCGGDSAVGITNRYGPNGPRIESREARFFHARPHRPCGPPSLLYSGYRVIPGGKATGTWRNNSLHLALRLKKEWNSTSTPPLERHGWKVVGLT